MLRQPDRSDPVTEVLAKKIFEVAQSGVRDCRRTAETRGLRPSGPVSRSLRVTDRVFPLTADLRGGASADEPKPAPTLGAMPRPFRSAALLIRHLQVGG